MSARSIQRNGARVNVNCVTGVYECAERTVRVNEDIVERHQRYMYNVVITHVSWGFKLARILIGNMRIIWTRRIGVLKAGWSGRVSAHRLRARESVCGV